MDQNQRDEEHEQAIEDREQAVDFLQSLRGKWIVGQALTIAARVLTDPAKPVEQREPSNAKDMLYLRDALFPLWSDIQKHLLEAEVAAQRRRDQDEAGDKQDEADFLRESQGEGR